MTEKKCLKCLSTISADSSERYGLHESCFIAWFDLKNFEEFTGIGRRSESGAPKKRESTTNWNTSFFQGQFRKYSAALAGESYIFKLKQDEAPELPDVEYVCNQIAKSTGLHIPDFYCINFFEERTFVTKNFVRKSTNANLAHIYHYLGATDIYDCETLVNIVLAQTGKPYDVDIFVRACLFDALIGNHDRHGRNLGFIVTAKGVSLAPIYDNPSALSLEQGPMLNAHWNPRGKISTKGSKEPSAKDYVDEFFRLGMQNSVCDYFARINPKRIQTLIQESWCSEPMKNALTKLISGRYEELRYAIDQKSK